MIMIESIGSGISLQDAGRPGWRRYGVPAGGAMDHLAMELANALLGNPTDACVLEIPLLGATVRAVADTWVSLAGADSCSRFAAGTARCLRAGERLQFDQKSLALYAYLAVPGGFYSERWLNSASADPRNGMGRVLQKGDRLQAQLAAPNVTTERVARRISSQSPKQLSMSAGHFELYRGSQYEYFSKAALECFIESQWTVSARSDRTGYRLEGATLELPESIHSEPVLPGSFQVPGNGLPIITMHDGPTVGGYPKIAFLQASDLSRMAQCAPGTKLSFSWID
jgi:allophanate hydrolase